MSTSNNTPAQIPGTDFSYSAGQSFTLKHTGYKPWSGRSYYGTRSGVSAVPVSTSVTVGRISEKAVQLIREDRQSTWVPKRALSFDPSTGHHTVSRGFCYRNGGLRWKAPFVPYSPFGGAYINGFRMV